MARHGEPRIRRRPRPPRVVPAVEGPTGTETPHRPPGVWAADPESVLELQRTAGNQAVVGLVSGGATLQREPKKDDPPIVPRGAVTAVGSDTAPPAGPVRRAEPSPAGGPVDPKRVPMKKAKPVPEHAVAAAYGRDPGKVFRSPSDYWHYQMWNFQRGPGFADDPPPAFEAGGWIAVAPSYPGKATTLPSYSAEGNVGLGPKPPRPNDSIPVRPGLPAANPADADLLETGTRPDGRARARAADYTAVYTDWATLGPVGRQQRIADIINAHLAREGIPPVRVAFGSMAPGSAQFSAALWSMSVSRADVEADQLSPTAFATLVDSAVHETQHTVTTFRGVRVALARGAFDDRSYLRDGIADEARTANQRRDPAKELSEEAAEESFEIYRISIDPQRANATQVGRGEVSRETVLARRDAARIDLALAEHGVSEAKTSKQRAAAEAEHARASQEWIAAHNAYVALPEETFSWRAGKAARAAVLERIELQERLQAARLRATEAARAQRTARAGSNRADTVAAFRASRAAEQALHAARQQLDGLTSTEPRLVGGRREMRDVPLTKAEIAKAPRPGPLETTDVEVKAAPPGAPRPADLAPLSPRSVPAPARPGIHRKVVDAPGGGIGTEWVKEGPDAGDGKRSERAGGVVIAGDHLVGIGGRRSDTTTNGDVSTTTHTRAGAGLTKEGVEATFGRVEEIAHGTDTEGKPITSTRATHASAGLTDQGVVVKAGSATTNQAGTTRSISGGATFDDKGVTGEAAYGLAGKSGTGVTVTARAGHQVEAAEPVEVEPGVFEVAYSVTDSRALGAGGSASRTSAGPSVGGGVGTSSASSQTGVRRFTSKSEALRFQKHAAILIEIGGGSDAPTTALGALAIPIGETRGSGEMEGSNWNASASYGASISYGEQKSTTHQLSVRRVSERVVDVTAVVSNDKIKDWSISGGITNTKGTSASSAWSVTFRFDLGTQTGRDAYELYTRTGLPSLQGGTLVSMTESSSAGDHDKVGVGPLGSAQWTGRTFESKTTTDQGVSQVFGGEKAHDQTPGRVGRLLGEDELHSSAVLSSRLENGKVAGYDALIKIKSESGEYNREQFGEIFLGAQAGKADAKPSGEWTLSADIKKEVIRELERNSDKFRNAKTDEERMRILSEMYKEGGARAAGGLVRYGGDFQKAWTLELKGDENFPGRAGRQRLKDQQKKLDAILVSTPDGADAVVREAKEAMDKLQARRTQVARPDKYTDLPAELRQQQLALVDEHVRDFRTIHERALKLSIKTNRGESADSTRAKIAAPGGYSNVGPGQREADQLRDRASILQDDIDKTGKAIYGASKALHRGAQAVALGVTSKQLNEQTASFRTQIGTAYGLDKRQMALKPTADGLREAWNNETDPAARTLRLKSLVTCLDERLKLMAIQLYTVRQAAAAIKPITTAGAMAANPEFWAGIAGDELSDD